MVHFNLFLNLHQLTQKLTLKRHIEIPDPEKKMDEAIKPTGKHKEITLKSRFHPTENQGGTNYNIVIRCDEHLVR